MNEIDWDRTPSVDDFLEMQKADRRLWWKIGSGHHQNLFDSAVYDKEHLESMVRPLVEKLWRIFVSGEYKSVFQLAEIHGMGYKGEQLGIELTKLSDKLGLTPPEPEKIIGLENVQKARGS